MIKGQNEQDPKTDLMDVVVDVLASNDGSNGVTLFLLHTTRTLELLSLLFETCLDSLRVAMLMVTLLDANHVVRVLLGQNLTIFDGLDRGMVVILVDLTVDGSGCLLMALLHNVLVYDGGSNLLVNSGVVVTSFGPVTVVISSILKHRAILG